MKMTNVEMFKRMDNIMDWLDENNFEFRMFDLYITVILAEPIVIDGEKKKFEVGIDICKNTFKTAMGETISTNGDKYDIFELCKHHLIMERNALNKSELYKKLRESKEEVKTESKTAPVGYYDVPRDYSL